jgi:hypothetical protein
MILLKVTALACAFSLAFAVVLELYFGLIARPYLFGFPRTKWPFFAAIVLIWAVSLKAAYYIVCQRRTFYGG